MGFDAGGLWASEIIFLNATKTDGTNTMTLARTAFYDPAEETLWIARRFFDVNTRLPKEEVRQWAQFLKRGDPTEDGRPVKKVNYLFIDRQSAAANYQVLSFVGVGVFYQEGGNRIVYIPPGGPVQFEVQTDFGIDLSAHRKPKTDAGNGGEGGGDAR
jgi:hypothetical protein